MAAERATAAEMMAPAAAVVMVGVMLGLGRVGGGSGCLLGLRRHGSARCFVWLTACFVWLTPTSALLRLAHPLHFPNPPFLSGGCYT